VNVPCLSNPNPPRPSRAIATVAVTVGERRRCGDRGRRRADRRPVDDQHRYRRYRRHRGAGGGAGGPARNWCASRSTATRRPLPCRISGPAGSSAASTAPLIGDFHYIGHKLLNDHPACAEALDKYRINPGNVGFKAKRDTQFAQIVEMAIRHGKPVRIGANWGSLDQELLTHLMDENSRSARRSTRAR
jgi:hypothetical protein